MPYMAPTYHKRRHASVIYKHTGYTTMADIWKLTTLLLLLLLGTRTTVSLPVNTSVSKLPATSRYLTTSGEEQAYVSAGSLVSFSNQLLAEEKSDVLDSLLYAELTASDVYDKTEKFTKWYTLYTEVLEEVGWQINEMNFSSYTPTNSHFTISDTVYGLLSPLCQAVQKEILSKLLNVWEKLNDFDQRVICFTSASGDGGVNTNVANFQIMPASRGNPGEVFFVFGGFYYESTTAVRRYLSYEFPKDAISLLRSVVIAKLKNSDYDLYREPVQKLLQGRAKNFIYKIDL